MSECRSCGAPIEWVRTRKKDGTTGKPTPVDVDEVDGSLLYADDGNLRPTSEVAYGLPLVEWMPPGPDLPPMLRSHFVSCPNAAKHRGRR